jgi:hypothetical protein
MSSSMARKRSLVKFSDLVNRNIYWITVRRMRAVDGHQHACYEMVTIGPGGGPSPQAATPGTWVTALISLTVGVGNDGRCEPWRGVGSSRGMSDMSGMT